jgi:hypothetical protein
MKKVILFVLFGWFFALRAPYDDTGKTFMSIVIGPFDSEQACKTELDGWQANAEMMGITGKFTGCIEKQEL